MPSAKTKPQIKKTTRRTKKRSYESYATAIHRVLKQVHPDVTISSKGMNVMESFVKHVLEAVGTESGKLVRQSKTRTLDARTIQAAVRLSFGGELAKHAISEGTKAVTKYDSGA